MMEANYGPADPETLHETIDILRVYSGMVLLSFLKHGPGIRETIARNFVARGTRCTQSIYAVWKAGMSKMQGSYIAHCSIACCTFTTLVRQTDLPILRSTPSCRYNFCRVHRTLRVTPAMAAGIADSA